MNVWKRPNDFKYQFSILVLKFLTFVLKWVCVWILSSPRASYVRIQSHKHNIHQYIGQIQSRLKLHKIHWHFGKFISNTDFSFKWKTKKRRAKTGKLKMVQCHQVTLWTITRIVQKLMIFCLLLRADSRFTFVFHHFIRNKKLMISYYSQLTWQKQQFAKRPVSYYDLLCMFVYFSLFHFVYKYFLFSSIFKRVR